MVQEKALDFCKNQKIKDAIVVSVDLLQSGNYEEIKRLNIEIIRPDINDCYADFRTDGKKFFYALGGI